MKRKINEPALHRCGEYLAERGLKLICAESMTAGFLSSTWALEVCSGDYYLGSIVCYDDEIKKNLLQVSPQLLAQHTAESAETTLALLEGLQKLVTSADVYLAITGLAFESTNPNQNRPVGKVYYAFSYNGQKKVFDKQFEGNAGSILIQTCNSIFEDLYTWIKKNNFNHKN